jgi:hypothetical protein
MERTKVIYDNYVLFENGVVLSLITNRFINGTVNQGYIRMCLYHERRERPYLHTLLAEAFIDNPNGFTCVDHIDRNRLNNDLSNLRWCSISQNNQNKSKQSNNTTGKIGITKWSISGLLYWRVGVVLDGNEYVAVFKRDSDTIPQEAIDARDEFKRQLHGEFASF